AGSGPAPVTQHVPVGSATVVRTDVRSAQQATGTLGYLDAYTLTLPGGLSAAAVGQSQVAPLSAQRAGARKARDDARSLAASQTAEAKDAVDNDELALGVARSNLDTARTALDQARGAQATACAGSGSPSPSCTAATQQVTTLTAQVDTLTTTVNQAQAAV